jgi:glycosyltransferase involved in cell wall biosynthesis
MMSNAKHAVVIACHNPPMPLLLDTLNKLFVNKGVCIYVVDSSPNDVTLNIKNKIATEANNSLSLDGPYNFEAPSIKYFRVPNCGIGHNYNVGISHAVKDHCDLITIFTDDVAIPDENRFSVEKISYFFHKNCDLKKDVLVLPQKKSQFQSAINLVDSGLTFSRDLFPTIKFREELILDQIDFDFCHQIIRNGGKFLIYPEIAIEVLPIGREIKNQHRTLPMWRLYLLTRNSISMALESKRKLTELRTVAYDQIERWSMNGIKSGQSFSGIFRAVLLGLIDGVSKNLGVTKNLQALSGNRFSCLSGESSQ